MLVCMFEQRYEMGPSSYFYFSGFLSGIQINPKNIPQAEFVKVQENTLQDDKNLPVLFNCFFQNYGGFECYFNQRKLFYRILPKNYTPPTVESNGIAIGEFLPKKWYFLAADHEKSSFMRPQFTAIINDKQVVALPLDYPKIDKNARISMIAICKNFVGQLSSFLLFKDPINNAKKLIQIYHSYEYGFYQNIQASLVPVGKGHSTGILSSEIFDSKVTDKMLLLFTPERTSNKAIFDCVEMRDAELMVNSGVCNNGPKSKLFYSGGLTSLLPLLDLIRGISLCQDETSKPLHMDDTLNEFLKLVNAVISAKSYSQHEQDQPVPFFNILFHLIGKLPPSAVNSQTIHLLAEIRFQIGDSKMQEQFFSNLMHSSDYWLNTDKMDVINEYWLFVKAIYSQNPVQHNKIFNIQNLIDLMVKISEIKDAGHCCEYHKNTYIMFYQGQIQSQQTMQRPSTVLKRKDSIADEGKISVRENQLKQSYNTNQQNLNQVVPTVDFSKQRIHHLDRYLAPIAGVLEGVLTSGGNEVLDQIQYIAKSLTVKSSPCFHLQMLKLLKVLLLDSYSKNGGHCASPADFAAQLLKSKGLQILLYLCSNSSFDVKAMCVKLIDVLSSHTTHIKMAIDPDVITYLCNIVLPRSMMETAFIREKSQIFKGTNDRLMIGAASGMEQPNTLNQYEMMDDEEGASGEEQNINHSDEDLEDHINQLLMETKQQPKKYQPLPPQKKDKKFGKGLFLEDDGDEDKEQIGQAIQKTEIAEQEQSDQEAEEILPKGRVAAKKASSKKKFSLGAFQDEIEQQDPFVEATDFRPSQNAFDMKSGRAESMDDDELLPGTRAPPPAPRSKGKPKLMFDFDDDDDDNDEDSNPPPQQKFNQTSKAYMFGKKQQSSIQEVNEEDDDDMKFEMSKQFSKPNQGSDFKILGFGKKGASDNKKLFTSTQKIPSLKPNKSGGNAGTQKKGLFLSLGKDEEEEFVSQRGQTQTIDEPHTQHKEESLLSKRNTFTIGNKNSKAIQFTEIEETSDYKKQTSPGGMKRFNSKQAEEPVSFANENVMSKSNLRQPKSFNFGFPADDSSDDEEEKVIQEEEKELAVIETEEDVAAQYYEQETQDNQFFEGQFFKEKRPRQGQVIESDEADMMVFGGSKKGSSLVINSDQTDQRKYHQRVKSNQLSNLVLDEEPVLSLPPAQPQRSNLMQKKKNLVIGGTTGATSDMVFDEPPQRKTLPTITQGSDAPLNPRGLNLETRPERVEEDDDQLVLSQGPKPKEKKALISISKNSKIFTNANNKLNIDTEAINELFTYGGEKGEVKMTTDEEMANFEQEIEEYASICIAAMNRKHPNDPIRYEKAKKSTFESKYLGGGVRDDEEEVLDKDFGPKKAGGLVNPRQQFMTPQSVRGIKKIEFSMTNEEKQAALEASGTLGKSNFGGTLGSQGLSTTKNINLKSGMFSNNTILEEMSANSNSKSSSSRQEFGFSNAPDSNPQQQSKTKQNRLSGQAQPFELGIINEEHQIIGKDKRISQISKGHLGGHLNQTIPSSKLSEPLNQVINQVKALKQVSRRNSDNFSELHQHSERKSEWELELERTKQSNDEYTTELENLYTSCLEWIINRAPSSLYENIVIDECDKISYNPAIQLLMTIVTYSNNMIRQRALNDLEMMAKWDSNNGTLIMTHPQFHQWLLELLMPYQDLTTKFQNLQGTSLAVYDIGCKLHTLLLKNACTSAEEEGYKKLNFVARWPAIIHTQLSQGLKDRNERDFDISNKLSRVLLTQLLSSLRDETCRMKPQIIKNLPVWQNIVYIIQLAEELMVGSLSREFAEYNSNDPSRDVNAHLFKWVQQDYLLYNHGSNDKSLWAEWDLIESVFAILENIYPDHITKILKNQHLPVDESVYALLEKCSAEEFNNIVEILMHDGTPYKPQSQQTTQSQPVPKATQSQKAKALLTGVLGGNKSQQAQPLDQSPISQQNLQSETSFIRNILNLLCIALSQSDSKAQVQQWLERLERFIKFLMTVSEVWKSRMVSTIYTNYQRKFADAITFAFSFLFHQIHYTNSTSSRMAGYSQNSTPLHSNSSSPKEQNFNKLYAQSLKNLMIFLINIVEYTKIRYTPAQLESHITACRSIFNGVLVRSLTAPSGVVLVETIMPLNDIHKMKQTDYDDFPECFYWEDWKVTFFYSEVIKKVVRKQLSPQDIQAYIQKRKSFAQHYMDTQISNDKTKDDILKRMQCDTVEVIGLISEEEFERKNRVALMNENFIREQGHHWKGAKKDIFGCRGAWRYAISSESQHLVANFYKSTEGVRAFMSQRINGGFQFYEKQEELEQRTFDMTNDQKIVFDLFALESKEGQSLQDLKKKAKKLATEDLQKMLGSDDDEEEKEEDEEDLALNEEQKIDPVIQFFSRHLTTREKISLKKQYINHLKDFIYTFRVKTKELLADLRCTILKPFYQRPGQVTLTSHDIIFFDDLFIPANLVQERDNIFFFKYQKKADDLLYKIIPLQDLKEIQKRRFLGRKTALELFLMSNKSFLLNFSTSEDRDQFAKKLLRQRNQRSYNLKYYDSLDPRRILKKRELTEKWQQWKISNFEYIMSLNQLSGRSYNDLSQYPVFPWIVLDNSSNQTPDIAFSTNTNLPAGSVPPPQGFRDLNKNMQLLGTAERQAEFRKKYDDMDSFASPRERFHCGSHYSNPGIVLHYLSRVSPYIDALVELHGKGLDTPDRGFHSVQDSLNSALADTSDVRELIPEFYYCPELFLNLNKIKFGTKQDGTLVNDVRLPTWSNNDPYLFVIFLREAFESHYVSQNLCSWIDYIFGYKQRDAEAEKCLNLYSQMTYEDAVDLDQVTDQLLKQSYQEQIYNYGQTPSQLFTKTKHPQKLARSQALKFNTIADSNTKIKVYKPVVQSNSKNQSNQANQGQPVLLSQEAILKAKFIDESTIIGLSKDGTITYFFWLSKAHELNPNTPFTCCEDKRRKFDNRQKYHGIEMYDRSIKKFDFPLLILNTHKCIIRGGFWGGKIAICPIEGLNQEPVSTLHAHQTTVTAITATANERLIISGSKSGDVAVWVYIGGGSGAGGTQNTSNESNWQLRTHFCDHDGLISYINISEDLGNYLTCSFDGTCNLYNLQNDKLFRTFQHPKLAPIHSGILTQTPLPACCFFSREDHHWYSYSLNGQPLEKQREECSHIISPQIIKDSHFMDKLVYGTEKGYLVFRQLPLLKQYRKQQVSTQYPVLSIIVSSERRFLLVGCGDGGLNVVTEPFSINQASNLTTQTSNIPQVTTTLPTTNPTQTQQPTIFSQPTGQSLQISQSSNLNSNTSSFQSSYVSNTSSSRPQSSAINNPTAQGFSQFGSSSTASNQTQSYYRE